MDPAIDLPDAGALGRRMDETPHERATKLFRDAVNAEPGMALETWPIPGKEPIELHQDSVGAFLLIQGTQVLATRVNVNAALEVGDFFAKEQRNG